MSALSLTFPPELVDAIALRVVEMLEARGLAPQTPATPYLDVDQAAEYIAAKPQRVYDLVSAGTLAPCRDGRRLLFKRADLDAYLTDGAS
jgi:excisionase family DNA binding protein